MNALPRLDAAERARLLGLIGVDRYQLRSTPMANVTTPSAPGAPVTAAASKRAPTPAPAAEPSPATTTPRSLLDDLAADVRTPRLVLLVEAPRLPDPRHLLLLEAIRRLLPPHQMLDVGDTPTRWPEFALVLGERAQVPDGTELIRAAAVHTLRGNAAGKRALWQALKPLRRRLLEP